MKKKDLAFGRIGESRKFIQGLRTVRLLKPNGVIGWMMRRKETFDSVSVGDIVCLAHYPFKPFKVIFKGKLEDGHRVVTVSCETPSHAERMFTAEEFEEAKYHITDEKET